MHSKLVAEDAEDTGPSGPRHLPPGLLLATGCWLLFPGLLLRPPFHFGGTFLRHAYECTRSEHGTLRRRGHGGPGDLTTEDTKDMGLDESQPAMQAKKSRERAPRRNPERSDGAPRRDGTTGPTSPPCRSKNGSDKGGAPSKICSVRKGGPAPNLKRYFGAACTATRSAMVSWCATMCSRSSSPGFWVKPARFSRCSPAASVWSAAMSCQES